ncbi:hypothetical protein A2V54_00510 [candidate division WWE3 bacterium RBG_19FT_COMBO_53_11]|uniref:Peptidase M16 N-terminal domain-containing protein n=1 Tax=candidate division WWE3 bacterium RBG_19FT_COMBO_53_11 TaxID=1802613 RepID=A0A1F4UIC9_UNCKA|nr:MAG: hypothetical protein A2V54_00510 [candidate division WWE3 bacterium RBG_19FT_COMBO_53_11]
MEFYKEFLSNGIRLVCWPMPHLRSATAMIGFAAGGRHEDAVHPGIAHFAEHIAFKGPRRFPTGQAILEAFQDLGSSANAGTSSEMTVFYVKSPALYLGEAVEIIADIAFDPFFTDENVRVESGAIVQELKEDLDDLATQAEDLSDRLIFGDHPLGGSVLGTLESLQLITADDLHGFRRRWYTTDRTVVGLVGNLEEQVICDLRRRLESVPASRGYGLVLPFTRFQSSPAFEFREKAAEQTNTVLGFHSYGRNHPKAEALQVLEAVLSSRLYLELREYRGLVYGVDASIHLLSDCGTIEIEMALDHGELELALGVVLGELNRLRVEPVLADQLRRIKRSLRGSIDISFESTAHLCGFMVEQEGMDGNIKSFEEIVAKIEAVTVADIQDVAQEIFVGSGLNLAIVGPKPRFRKIKNLIAKF